MRPTTPIHELCRHLHRIREAHLMVIAGFVSAVSAACAVCTLSFSACTAVARSTVFTRWSTNSASGMLGAGIERAAICRHVDRMLASWEREAR